MIKITAEDVATSIGKICMNTRPCQHCEQLAALVRALEAVRVAAQNLQDTEWERLRYHGKDWISVTCSSFKALQEALAAVDKISKGEP